MAFVRIIVDGASLLHQWTNLAPGKPRLSEAAREELFLRLIRYFDATGTPITVVFSGSEPAAEAENPAIPGGVECVHAPGGQTAEQWLRRLAHRHRPTGDVLMVTDPAANHSRITEDGGAVCRCAEFIRTVETTLQDLEREIQHFNQQERSRFLRAS